MEPKQILKEAEALSNKLTERRRCLHKRPEVGFDLAQTTAYVKSELNKIGCTPADCGKAGVTVSIGGKRPGKVFLLRADMDALPIREESGEAFSSENENMHACGHDLHTAMLLGAAELLKAHEDEINGTVKLMFQPSEETLEGANDMIGAGVLENPKVDAALMIHVISAMPLPAGTVVVCGSGVSAPGADFFSIKISGKGCHGSMPNKGVDPINAAAHIVTALQTVSARELSVSQDAVLTFGSIHGGNAPNIIPDSVELTGSLRTYDEEVRNFVKKRLTEIVSGIASTLRAEAEVSFDKECPVLENDAQLAHSTAVYVKELLGSEKAFSQEELSSPSGSKKSGNSLGSEDFSFVSRRVPSIMLSLAAGEPQKGFVHPQHHPKVMFDESVLPAGSAVYAYTAMRWLEDREKGG